MVSFNYEYLTGILALFRINEVRNVPDYLSSFIKFHIICLSKIFAICFALHALTCIFSSLDSLLPHWTIFMNCKEGCR